ncbi:methyl-accepting chemotaxis protein [Methylobacter tundripaludum]|uniref:methyl-accepting chemotaxis protein n=1 Tax=Methylobacter tundripaludum TaxID=173365 RepID=UPI0004DF9633|nr:methyl-accepting chemotaxis protein [Methylobacter tundripaludum]
MFKNLTIKIRFILILGTLVIGFSLFGIATFKAMTTLNVNGPVYQRIAQGKDIIADVLPPPEYIIESYMVALQLTVAEDFYDLKTQALVSRFKKLRSAYDARHSFWLTQPLDQELHDLLLERSYLPAQAFYAEAEQRFLPAIQAGDRDGALAGFQEMRRSYDQHRVVIDELLRYTAARNAEDERQAQAMTGRYNSGLLGIFSFSVAMAIVLTVWVSRGILRSLKTAQQVAGDIADGDLNSSIDIHQSDEIGDLLRSMETMQQQLLARITADRKAADETLRVKIALDNVSTGVMIADNDRNIIYVNREVINIFGKAEAKMGRQLSKFSMNGLIGANMDFFHKNPSHQANMLNALAGAYEANMTVGGRSMVVTANPVVNEQGQRLGTVAEWHDRTDEVTAENEVAAIVEAAAMGDFSMRFDVNGKEGFLRHLGEDINRLVQTSETGLNEVVRILNALSRGDLTETITNDYAGTFGQLKNDSNTTVEKLKDIISQIKDATDSINTGTKEIASGNNDLSYRTEQQAASLQQTAASMEELTSAVQHNAANAQHANRLAVDASDIAGKGVDVIGQVVATMNDINESSRKIGDIISVIDDIAFQTNILALNAAVEAARAGEQGKGFAVVAIEVRNLAQRATTAAEEIKNLINDSVDKVAGGSKLVNQAGLTMREIVASIRGVTDTMAEITSASAEQRSGIEQVNQAIAQMDDVTQQNAALVEQAAAAAESLEEQAQNLAVTVSGFKVGDHSGSSYRLMPHSTAPATQRKAQLATVDAGGWEEF